MPLTRKRFLGLAGRGALGAAAYTTFGCFDRSDAGAPPDGKACPPGTKVSELPFNYRGKAVGVRGEITDPLPGKSPDQKPEKISDQAVVTLDQKGGHGEARVVDFRVQGIAYVNEAHSLVTGNPDLRIDPRDPTQCQRVFRTVVTATVSGLEVDGVVRADTIVANLESEQPETKDIELEMLPVGYFANLRIRGYLVDLRYPADYLETLRTKRKKSEIDRGIGDEVRKIESEMGAEDGSVCGKHAYPRGLGEKEYVCSIFSDRSIRAAVKGIPGVSACRGGRIHVDNLGDIYLGQFSVEADLRKLTMLRVELASPPTGRLEFASVEGDGGRPS